MHCQIVRGVGAGVVDDCSLWLYLRASVLHVRIGFPRAYVPSWRAALVTRVLARCRSRIEEPYRTNRIRPLRGQRTHHCKLGAWNCRSLSSNGNTRNLFNEVWARGFEVVALQEVRQYSRNCTIYQSGGETRELGVHGARYDAAASDWVVAGQRMCRLKIRERFFNLSIINVHSPHLGNKKKHMNIRRLQGRLRHRIPEWAMEHHATKPFSWNVGPGVRGHLERRAVQSECIEFDVRIVRISQGLR